MFSRQLVSFCLAILVSCMVLGLLVALSLKSNRPTLRTVEQNDIRLCRKTHNGQVSQIRFCDQDSKCILTASLDGCIIETTLNGIGSTARTIANNANAVYGLDLISNQKILSVSWDGTVHLLEKDTQNVQQHIELTGNVSTACLLRRNNFPWLLACNTSSQPGKIFLVTEGLTLAPTAINTNQGNIKILACTSDGSHLAAGHDNGSIVLYNTSSWEVQSVFSGGHNPISAIAFSTDGEMIYIGNDSGLVYTYRKKDNGIGMQLSYPGPINHICTTTDSRYLFVAIDEYVDDNGALGGIIGVFDCESNKNTIVRIPSKGSIRCTALSPDSRFIAFGSVKGELFVCSVKLVIFDATVLQ